MTKIYTITELSNLTNHCRISISKYLKSDKNFKITTKKNQVRFKTNLDISDIKKLFSEKKLINLKNRKAKKPSKIRIKPL